MDNRNRDISKAGNGRNFGFVDDFSNDDIKTPQKIRNNNAGVIYSNPLENEKRPKRRITKMSRKRYRGQNVGVVVLSLFLFAVLAFAVYFIVKSRNEVPVGYGERDPEMLQTPTELQTEDVISNSAAETESAFKNTVNGFVTVPNSAVHEGSLILVNYKYEYVFPKEDILVSMYDKTANYSVSSTETYIQKEVLDSFNELIDDLYENSGCDEVIVVSAFRSVEKQQEIYQDRLDRYGSEYAASYVADPGYSEHHTGLAMDLSIYTSLGLTYDIEEYKKCAWFNENYDNYGYILRYPEEKAGITSINYESWHYRYVGLPHSLIMDKLNLCLEEYIDYLKDYTADGKVLKFNSSTKEIANCALDDTLDKNENVIYYVPASNEETTQIPIVENTDYMISGNNVDGFIVTLTLKK